MIKPFIFGATAMLATEILYKPEEAHPHPVHEHIVRDRVTGVVNVYGIIGSTVVSHYRTDASLVTVDMMDKKM